MTANQQQQINSRLAECRDAIRLRHLAIKTEETYLGWLARYMPWLVAHGRDFATSELRIAGYLTSMAHRGVTASTQNQAFNAILFFYRHVLREDLKDINALRAVKAVAQEHDMEGTLTPHNLRHAFADHTLQNGGNIRDLQAVLGHSHLNTTMIYVHAEVERLRSPLDALAAVV